MEQKSNDDVIASKIEQKMDLISAGQLSAQEASKVLVEIKQLIAQMQPAERATQEMYFDMFRDKVARFYLLNGPVMEK